MLRQAGFKDVAVKRTANHFPVSFLVQQFLWACGWKVEKVPSFGGLTVGLFVVFVLFVRGGIVGIWMRLRGGRAGGAG